MGSKWNLGRAHTESSWPPLDAPSQIDAYANEGSGPSDSYDCAFFDAILYVQSGRYAQARRCIDRARDILEIELTALLGESYARCYNALPRKKV